MSRLPRGIAGFAVAAGVGDAATGLALVLAPLWTLRRMGIANLPAEPVFVRWIGAFVLAVGLSYLYPFLLRGGGEGRLRTRLATVFEVTALARSLIALVAGSAVAAGELEVAWIGVPLFDFAVVVVQILLLRHSGLRHE